MSSILERGDALADRYVIRTLIGAGNFGAVYSALDRTTGDEVAVKMLLPNAAAVPDLLQRFEREAEICAQLHHPNTARFRFFGLREFTEEPFMVFDLVRGLPLGKLIAVRGPLRVDEACAVMIRVLESLGEAHNLGILHRDLKPDNIIIVAEEAYQTEPNFLTNQLCPALGIPRADHPSWQDLTQRDIKVVDFGLGKILEIGDRRTKALTVAGTLAGTAHYMSPEQARSQDLDYRADVYGASILLYKLLSGAEPFTGVSAMDVALKHISQPIPPLPGVLADHPIQSIINRGAAKDRDERYASAAEMQWALHCILDPGLYNETAPHFDSPPEIRAKRRGLFARLFAR